MIFGQTETQSLSTQVWRVAYTNLIPNPSGETGSVVGHTSGVSVVTDTDAYAGTKMFSYPSTVTTGNSTLAPTIGQSGTGSGTSGVPVTPGLYYNARCRIKATNSGIGWLTVALRIYWYDSTGAQLSTSTLVTVNTPGQGVVYDLVGSASVAAPTSAVYAAVRPVYSMAVQGSNTSCVATYDAVMLVEGALPPDYFDGDTTDTTSARYDWLGTAHASRATRSELRTDAADRTPLQADRVYTSTFTAPEAMNVVKLTAAVDSLGGDDSPQTIRGVIYDTNGTLLGETSDVSVPDATPAYTLTNLEANPDLYLGAQRWASAIATDFTAGWVLERAPLPFSAGAVSTPRANINPVRSPNFEGGSLSNWTLSGTGWTGTSSTFATTWFRVGTGSARMVGTKDNNTTSRVLSLQSPTGTNGYVVTPGSTITISAYFKVNDDGAQGIRIRADYYKADGSPAAVSAANGTSLYGINTPAIGTIGRYATTFNLGNDVAFISVSLQVLSNVALDTVDIQWDAVQIDEGQLPSVYSDGDQPGATWTGTARNSPSSWTDPGTGWGIHCLATSPDATPRTIGTQSQLHPSLLPPVTAGQTYTGVADVYVVSKTGTPRLRLEMFPRASDGTSSTGSQTGILQTLNVGWNRTYKMGVMPANTFYLSINPEAYLDASGAAVDCYITNFMLVDGDLTANLPAYFDGETPGSAWTGLPHASTSRRYYTSAPGYTLLDLPFERPGGVPVGPGACQFGLQAGPVSNTCRVVSGAGGTGDKIATDSFADGPAATLPATSQGVRLAVFATGYVATGPEDVDDEYLATLPFSMAERELGGGSVPSSAARASVGWYGTRTDPDRGAFAIVKRDTEFADLVGERIRITYDERSVVAYVKADLDVDDDIVLTRRLFLALDVLATDSLDAIVEVVS